MNTSKMIARARAEVAVVDRIRTLRAEGKTLRKVAESLNANGIRTSSGRGWSVSTVRWVLAKHPTREQMATAKIMRPRPIGSSGDEIIIDLLGRERRIGE